MQVTIQYVPMVYVVHYDCQGSNSFQVKNDTLMSYYIKNINATEVKHYHSQLDFKWMTIT